MQSNFVRNRNNPLTSPQILYNSACSTVLLWIHLGLWRVNDDGWGEWASGGRVGGEVRGEGDGVDGGPRIKFSLS